MLEQSQSAGAARPTITPACPAVEDVRRPRQRREGQRRRRRCRSRRGGRGKRSENVEAASRPAMPTRVEQAARRGRGTRPRLRPSRRCPSRSSGTTNGTRDRGGIFPRGSMESTAPSPGSRGPGPGSRRRGAARLRPEGQDDKEPWSSSTAGVSVCSFLSRRRESDLASLQLQENPPSESISCFRAGSHLFILGCRCLEAGDSRRSRARRRAGGDFLAALAAGVGSPPKASREACAARRASSAGQLPELASPLASEGASSAARHECAVAAEVAGSVPRRRALYLPISAWSRFKVEVARGLTELGG